MRLTTTLNRIRACGPCTSGWRTLLKHVGEDFDPEAEINLLTILASNGVPDMLWALRATVQDSKRTAAQLAIEFAEQLAIEFAEQALPLFDKRWPNNRRPRLAIKAARDYLEWLISLEELRAAGRAADAAYAAYAYAAYAYAYAAYADADAADADAYAYAAYADAAYAYAYADAAYAYADAYAYAYAYVAREKARETQAQIIRSILE